MIRRLDTGTQRFWRGASIEDREEHDMRTTGRAMYYAAVASALFLSVATASGKVYEVGPGQKYETISQIAERLTAGDVVEIAGDISDSATISVSGTPDKPVIIRGVTSIKNGEILRPQITPASNRSPFTLKVSADWAVLEGLGFTGFRGQEYGKAALVIAARNTVIRNRYFHVYDRDQTRDTPRSRAFASKRGMSEPIVEGANNLLTHLLVPSC